MEACKKCAKSFPANELSAEEECFGCSTGDSTDACDISTRNIRESLHNIAQGLAIKTDVLTKEAKVRMREGIKDKAS